MPADLIGTDLPAGETNFNTQALELLEENGVSNFLTDKDFVFMMHQGYMFWYFRADGEPDPAVYGFREGRNGPDALGKLSAFTADIEHATELKY